MTQYGDLYDEDTQTLYDPPDGSTRCKHGTYIGTPGGPDLMCGWCEDGVSDEDFALYLHNQEQAAKRTHIRHTLTVFWILLIRSTPDSPLVQGFSWSDYEKTCLLPDPKLTDFLYENTKDAYWPGVTR